MTDTDEDLKQVQQWWKDKAQSNEDLRGLQREIDKVLQEATFENVKNGIGYLGCDDSDAPSDAKLSDSLRHLRCNFAIADAIAMKYKNSATNGAKWIANFVALSATGIWAFQNGKTIAKEAPVILGELNLVQLAGLICLILFTLLSFLSRWRFQRLRNNLLTARTLAEALRVDFFQQLNGSGFNTLQILKDHLPESDDHSLIPIAFAEVQKGCDLPGVESHQPHPNSIAWTKKHWLKDQSKWFRDKVPLEAAAAALTETRLSQCFLLTGIAVVGSLATLVAPDVLEFPLIRSWLEVEKTATKEALNLPRMLFDLLFPILGICSAFFHQKSAGHAITAQKYRQAHLSIENAIKETENAAPDVAIKVFERLAHSAIAETADWGAHQREQSKHIAFR